MIGANRFWPDAGTRGAGGKPSLWSMLGQVLYIGTIGYGGPTAWTYLRAIFVNDLGWFSEEEFLEAMSLAQILPGSTGVTAVSYFGYRRFGYFGAVVFPLVFLAPSIAAILVLSWAYFTYASWASSSPCSQVLVHWSWPCCWPRRCRWGRPCSPVRVGGSPIAFGAGAAGRVGRPWCTTGARGEQNSPFALYETPSQT